MARGNIEWLIESNDHAMAQIDGGMAHININIEHEHDRTYHQIVLGFGREWMELDRVDDNIPFDFIKKYAEAIGLIEYQKQYNRWKRRLYRETRKGY